MKLRLLILLCFCAAVFLGPNSQHAYALSCADLGSPQEALEVFSGAVYGEIKQIKVDLKQDGWMGTKEKTRNILVEVERSWKTEVDSQVIVATDYTWGYEFKKGEKYLIYIIESDGEYSSSPCSQTLEMDTLSEAEEWFGKGLLPQQQVNLESQMRFMSGQDVDLMIVISVVLVLLVVFFMFRKARKKKGENTR